MARKSDHSAAETLQEIESLGDRLLEWVSSNPALVLGTAIGILIVAAGYGFFSSARQDALDEASAELSEVDDAYRSAMGAAPGSFEITEPANAEAAHAARSRYAGEYRELARRFAGTTVGGLASLHAGLLQSELGEWDEALATWEAGVEALSGPSAARALLLSQLGVGREHEGQWLQAGEAYAAAAEIQDYPLRFSALADAARCFAEAGEAQRALLAYQRLERDAPDFRPPEYVQARIEELRVAAEAP